MRIALISTYDQGHQPYGLGVAAAFLEARGHMVRCFDTSVGSPDADVIAAADAVGFYLPMHTATRLAAPWIARVRAIQPRARLGAFGLYATLNRDYLRELGVHWIAPAPLDRNRSLVPLRGDLKPPARYAQLQTAAGPVDVAYTEASHGCKHRCRHCPVVPVYEGAFRTVRVEAVLADIRQQIDRGARHVTFGDPDFFNGPAHAARVVESLHRELPEATYDCTIKVEHLLRHQDLLPVLRETGCLFVTSAVESLDDRVLAKLEKGHTRRDFEFAVELTRHHGLTLAPTFIAFHPWTTRESYRDFLQTLVRLDLVEGTGSVQLALRLLITRGSRLVELDDIQPLLQGFDPPSLLHRWRHPDPRIDALAVRTMKLVAACQELGQSRTSIFEAVWNEAFAEPLNLIPRAAIPYLNEPWYC
jgi:radical SAM superfamily enzyme YgiQ (UPF0313 family)